MATIVDSSNDGSNCITMDEDEYTEHLILSSLEDCHFNLSFNLSRQQQQQQNHHHHHHHDGVHQHHQQQHQNHHHHRHHELMHCEVPQESVSTVSLTTEEELLDEMDLFGDGDSSFVDTDTGNNSNNNDDENNDDAVVEKQVLSPPPSPPTTPTAPAVAVSPEHEGTKEGDVSNAPPVAIKQRRQKQEYPPAGRRKSAHKERCSSVSSNEGPPPGTAPAVRVETPTEFDILCGQSRVCSSHGGNKCFQVVLDQFAERYDAATTKQEKMTMTKEVVAILHNAGGRFLKQTKKKDDGGEGVAAWEEISNVAARDKVSHALRTKVASWKRQQQQQQQIGGGGGGAAVRRSSTSSSAMRSKSKLRRGGGGGSHRRSSVSSIATSASDIVVASSFDGSDSTTTSAASAANVFGDLMAAQQEIFATLSSSSSSSHYSPHHRRASAFEPYPPQRRHTDSAVPCRRTSSYF